MKGGEKMNEIIKILELVKAIIEFATVIITLIILVNKGDK